MMKAGAKILLARFSSLGDVVLASAALREIKRQDPSARLTLLTKPAYAPLFEGHSALDSVWSLDLRLLKTWVRARAEKFDGYLDLHASLRSRFLGWMLMKPSSRVKTYRRERQAALRLKSQAPAPPDVVDRAVHAAAQLMGAAPGQAKPWIEVSERAKAWARGALASLPAGPRVICAPGAAHQAKRWPESHFATVLAGLHKSRPDLNFVFVGGPQDSGLASGIAAQAGLGTTWLNLCGRSDVAQLAGVLQGSVLFIGNDSGPLHLSSALNTPSLAIFGPTVRAFGFYPRGAQDLVFERELDCRPCSLHGGETCPLGHHDCMNQLAPEPVLAAALARL